MRKTDIKPGVVYAYQRFGQHPTDGAEPLVFLGFTDFGKGPVLSTLWQDMRGTSERRFRPARPGRKIQAGRASNDGSIGYPAALLAYPEKPSAEELATLAALTLDDFARAPAAWHHDRLFLVVTSMARVLGPWEGR